LLRDLFFFFLKAPKNEVPEIDKQIITIIIIIIIIKYNYKHK